MGTYRVKTLAICVKNNRIAKHGEIITDAELTVNASELIETGAIELAVAETAAVVAVTEVVETDATATEETETKVKDAENVSDEVAEKAFSDDSKEVPKTKAKGAAAVVADANAK